MNYEAQITERKGFVARRMQAYADVFADKESTKLILADLKKFCRAEDSTFSMNARESALLEGRREVYLRIQDHLKLGHEELFKKLTTGEM